MYCYERQHSESVPTILFVISVQLTQHIVSFAITYYLKSLKHTICMPAFLISPAFYLKHFNSFVLIAATTASLHHSRNHISISIQIYSLTCKNRKNIFYLNLKCRLHFFIVISGFIFFSSFFLNHKYLYLFLFQTNLYLQEIFP